MGVRPEVAAGVPCVHVHCDLGLGSVFEGTAAAGSTYEIFEQVAVNLPESVGLGHFGQVVHTELKAKLFQVLRVKRVFFNGMLGFMTSASSSEKVFTSLGEMKASVRTDLCIIAHSSRQQREGVFSRDSPLDNMLTQPFQAVLAVRRGQVQQP